MIDVEEMLERQARWQRSRKTLSWPEKIRMAEAVRESVEAFRAAARRRPVAPLRDLTNSDPRPSK